MHAVVAFGMAVLASLGPGPFTKGTHPGIGSSGPRDYYVYQPSVRTTTGPQPLVVFLHGCTQTAKDAAIGTRWTELAEKRDFIAVFPEQSVAANGTQCWNWFLPDHQKRGVGEPGIIAEITRSVIASTGADPSRVYVMGISAGADMAMIMGATYPDLFAATSGFAGCAYATCADVTGTLAKAAMGPYVRVLPALLFQGTADVLNDFALGETMARQWVGTDGLSQVPSSVEHVGLDATFLAGLGTTADTCVRNRQFPCASGVRGNKPYPYSIEHHADAVGCAIVDFWILHGLGHDYPGGDPAGTFTDPAGPDVTTAAYDWFLRHRLGRPCGGVAAASAGSVEPAPANPPPSAGTPSPAATLPHTGATPGVDVALLVALTALSRRRVGRRRRRRRGAATAS
ncbi:MAG TPA: PHB depolymerase family esterase [Acidimicrobiales bacterium]|nr:PHB depolymerase family esterase [Acidimicrobiales bacterium]